MAQLFVFRRSPLSLMCGAHQASQDRSCIAAESSRAWEISPDLSPGVTSSPRWVISQRADGQTSIAWTAVAAPQARGDDPLVHTAMTPTAGRAICRLVISSPPLSLGSPWSLSLDSRGPGRSTRMSRLPSATAGRLAMLRGMPRGTLRGCRDASWREFPYQSPISDQAPRKLGA